MAIFVLIACIGNGLAFQTESEELISLYDENDSIVELTDANFVSAVQHPERLWVVEFYAHWCGHCQRFSPTWKNLAKEFDGKSIFDLIFYAEKLVAFAKARKLPPNQPNIDIYKMTFMRFI